MSAHEPGGWDIAVAYGRHVGIALGLIYVASAVALILVMFSGPAQAPAVDPAPPAPSTPCAQLAYFESQGCVCIPADQAG